MEIRAAIAGDLERVEEIDGSVDSTQYLHLDQAGEGLSMSWRLEPRPLRQALREHRPLSDSARFASRQVMSGVEEGIVLVAEHEGALVALAVAQLQPALRVLELLDIRVDFDFRRQGIGSAMAYQVISHARQTQARAVGARVTANNMPANQFLAKMAFQLAGLDTHFGSNHDLVKETVSLFWYAALE